MSEKQMNTGEKRIRARIPCSDREKRPVEIDPDRTLANGNRILVIMMTEARLISQGFFLFSTLASDPFTDRIREILLSFRELSSMELLIFSSSVSKITLKRWAL